MMRTRSVWELWERSVSPGVLSSLLPDDLPPRLAAQLVHAAFSLVGDDLPPEYRRALGLLRPYSARTPLALQDALAEVERPSLTVEGDETFAVYCALWAASRMLLQSWEGFSVRMALTHIQDALAYSRRSLVDYSRLPSRLADDYLRRHVVAGESICAAIRHVVRNPGATVPMAPRLTGCGEAWEYVREIALACEDDPGRDHMGVLGDALVDAGVTCPEVLGHFSVRRPHPWGCWVLETILGRRRE